MRQQTQDGHGGRAEAIEDMRSRRERRRWRGAGQTQPARFACVSLSAVVVTSATLCAVLPGKASAFSQGLLSLVQEPFSGSSLVIPTDWELPDVPSEGNAACLTASANTGSNPIPGCDGTHDSAGGGALRLTAATTAQEGGVANLVPLPSSEGLDVTFDTYQYANSGDSAGGDGIMFFLAAVNPADPEAPTELGEPGGDLAYSGGGSGEGTGVGLVDGYLGVGLDVYGNYTNNDSDGAGCTDPTWAGDGEAVPNEVTVRGPGSGSNGYCLLSSTAADGGLHGGHLAGSGATRASAEVPVEVAVNPTATGYTTNSGLTLPPYSYVVAVTPLGAATQLVSGTLPYDSFLPASDSSWLDPQTGVPLQFAFGFAASSGAATDIHEVTDLQASPVATNPAVLGLTLSDSAAGLLTDGSSVTYTASGSVSASSSALAAAPQLLASFSSGVTPESASGPGWSCSTIGSAVNCAYTGALPINPGTGPPAVSILAFVASNAVGTQDVSAFLWQSGAVVAQAADPGTATTAIEGSPVLGLTFADNAAGRLTQGETVTYTATASVSSAGGSETGVPGLVATFPPSEAIQGATGTGWSCAVVSDSVTCSWTGGPILPGSPLGPISVTASVAGDGTGAATPERSCRRLTLPLRR